jgi:hypothetical protein
LLFKTYLSMKSVFKLAGLFLIILSVNFVYSCKKDKPVPPSITTTSITAISYTTAVSGGIVIDEGTSPLLSMGICWSTSPGATIEDSKTTQNGAMGSFVSNSEQLSQNTKYYVKAYATSSAGTGYGNEVSFTTTAVTAPLVSTAQVTTITVSTAVSGGEITSDNGGSVLERGVCWSKTNNPTISGSKTTDGSGIGTFVSNITGLEEGTIYYIRSYATNMAGTAYGESITVTTLSRPTLTTNVISGITIFSALSGGNVTSEGSSVVTDRGICWSTLSNPTVTDSKASNGNGLGSFSSNIKSLIGNTTYHIRAYATNSAGTAYGQDLEFTTPVNTLNAGLLAYYPLDGNANDESGNNQNGVVNGAEVTYDRNNISGKALSFFGSSYITLGSSFDSPMRTINVWFYANVIDVTERHIYISDNPLLLNGFTQIKVKEINGIKQIRSSAGIPGGIAEGNATITLNRWYMITLVVDEFATRHYLDGVLIGTFNNDYAKSSNGDPLALLGTSRVYDRSFVGRLDDARIYNRALTEIEIKSLFNY